MKARRLTTASLQEIRAFLQRHPEETIALRGMLNMANLSLLPWMGAYHREQLTGIAVVIPRTLCLIWTEDFQAAEVIGAAIPKNLSPCMVVGPSQASKALWSSWSSKDPIVVEQTLFAAHDVPPDDVATGFRLAKDEESAQIAEYAGLGEAEETGHNSHLSNPARFEKMVLSRIQRNHSWVIEHDNQLVFQAHLGPALAEGAQLCGTYVPPSHRGKGWSTKGICSLLHMAIPQYQWVVLRVDKDNEPAVRCYQRCGFQARRSFTVLTPQHGA
jgi:RimJ/RimL family protein N-acetyltransferase